MSDRVRSSRAPHRNRRRGAPQGAATSSPPPKDGGLDDLDDLEGLDPAERAERLVERHRARREARCQHRAGAEVASPPTATPATPATPNLDRLAPREREVFRDQTEAYALGLELRALAQDQAHELAVTLGLIVWVEDRRRALESGGVCDVPERPGGEAAPTEPMGVPLHLDVFECAPRNMLAAFYEAMAAVGETLSLPMPPKQYMAATLHNAGYTNSEIQELLDLASIPAARVMKSTAWAAIDELAAEGRAEWLEGDDDR